MGGSYPLPDEVFTLGDYITIPSPRHVTFTRGVLATQPPSYRRTFSVRDDHYETMRSAASLLGMSIQEFIRWSALAVANETIHQYEVKTGERTNIQALARKVNEPLALDPTEHSEPQTRGAPLPQPKEQEVKDVSTIVSAPTIKKIVL